MISIFDKLRELLDELFFLLRVVMDKCLLILVCLQYKGISLDVGQVLLCFGQKQLAQVEDSGMELDQATYV